MKQLMENWRKYLEEGAVTDTTNLGALFLSANESEWLYSRDGETRGLLLFDTEEFLNSIEKFKFKPKPRAYDNWDELEQEVFKNSIDPLNNKTVQKNLNKSIKGFMEIEKWVEHAPCYATGKGVYSIRQSAAISGYGPLLYDAALLYIKSLGAAAMADRSTISKAAQNIYKQWLTRGTGTTGIKIKARKFDDIENPQTKPKRDDCYIHPETGKEKVDSASNYVYSTKSSLATIRGLQKNARTSIKEFISRAYPYGVYNTEETVDRIEELFYAGGGKLWDKLYKG